MRRKVKGKVRDMMLRNEAYSTLIKCFFPNHIRLSIHPHSNIHKFGVNLVGGNPMFCGSPWHNVTVFDEADKSWGTMKRKEAEEMGFKLSEDEYGLKFFVKCATQEN